MPGAGCGRDKTAVAVRNEQKEQLTTTLGWGIASVLAMALVCGAAKLLVDLKNSQTVPRRRQPWEL